MENREAPRDTLSRQMRHAETAMRNIMRTLNAGGTGLDLDQIKKLREIFYKVQNMREALGRATNDRT